MKKHKKIMRLLSAMTVLIFMCTMPAAVLAADETYDFTVELKNSKYTDATIQISLLKTQTTLTALKEAIENEADGIRTETVYTNSAHTAELTASNIAEFVNSGQELKIWVAYTGTLPTSLNTGYQLDEVSTMLLFGMCGIAIILLIIVTVANMGKRR
jgi:flagellar capping protein FliD